MILPVRNEARFIRDSLGAVLSQDYPRGRMEVIVADGMSRDGTREIVAGRIGDFPNLRLIDNPAGIVPTGLNRALRQARGEIVVRVDGHTLIESDYVRQCVAALERAGADNVGGAMRARGEGWFGRAVAAATSSPFGVGGARFHYSRGEEWVDTVYMGAWRREIFDRIGLFDEEMVRDQDDELNYRLLDSGGRILLSPAIRSSYTVRGTWRTLWRQYLQYGFWKVRVMQKHPRQIRPRQLAPPLLVAGLLGSAAAACVAPGAVLLWGALPAVYLLAALGASCRVAGPLPLPSRLFLPAVFATLHVGYGVGLLGGLVRFMPKWRLMSAPRGQAGGGPAS